MAKMRTGRMSEPPVTGKALSKTKITAPNSKPTGQDYVTVSKAGDKNKQRQAEAAAAPKPMSKGKKIAIAAGGVAAMAGSMVYEAYHSGLRDEYNASKYPKGRDAYNDPSTRPSNRELRKWKKGQ